MVEILWYGSGFVAATATIAFWVIDQIREFKGHVVNVRQ